MLAAFVFHLQPRQDLVLEPGHGKAIHGMFYDLLRRLDPELSASLHQGEGVRPFTLSPFLESRRWRAVRRAKKGDVLVWRCTLLHDRLVQRLQSAWLPPGPAPEFSFLGSRLRVHRLLMSPENSRGWANVTSPGELMNGCQSSRRFEMEFFTPTAFRRGDHDLPLPLPELVFGSYLQRARKLFPDPEIPAELTHQLPELVYLARHNIRSAPFFSGSSKVTGFVGTAEFVIPQKAPDELARWIHWLAHLAFYLGTGRKTTMGMGMTRLCCRGGSRPSQ